jgi:hypothetical protein
LAVSFILYYRFNFITSPRRRNEDEADEADE